MKYFAVDAEDVVLQMISNLISKGSRIKLVGVTARNAPWNSTTGKISLSVFEIGIDQQVTPRL
jgi:hypothetical protein